MPPIYLQDPVAAAERGAAWRWTDLPLALADVASETWMVALLALALFAWLEQEVKDVVRAFVPLAFALLAAGALAFVARWLGAVPRPVGAGTGVGPLVRHAFATGHAAAVGAFAAYALLAYGRRARSALLFALVVAAASLASGAKRTADLAGGGAAGAVLGGIAYVVALRLAPGGHLARLRSSRRSAPALADPPSA